jgi:hypothetical protein
MKNEKNPKYITMRVRIEKNVCRPSTEDYLPCSGEYLSSQVVAVLVSKVLAFMKL